MYLIQTPTINKTTANYRIMCHYLQKFIDAGESSIIVKKICYDAVKNTTHYKTIKIISC